MTQGKRSRKSLEDVEVIKVQLQQHIERCIELHDAMTNYQANIVEPLLKEPFCLTCGDPITDTYGIWKCQACRKWDKQVANAKYKTTTRATDGG